ncbi:MAG: DUF58 domain-containing protein [Planctomycetota bacterium]
MAARSPAQTDAPNLDPAVLAQVGALELRARLVIDGLLQGLHRSPLQGESIEFAQHRPYTAGDDLRRLDWKVAAKTNKLYLKQYARETNLDLMLLVDASGSMAYRGPDAPWTKYDAASTVAAALAHLAVAQQDRAALAVFDHDTRMATRLSNNTGHWRSIAEALANAAPQPAQPGETPNPEGRTDLAGLFDRITAELKRRSLIVLLSDLFDTPDVIDRGLAKLRFRGHDVVVLHVMDDAELSFPFQRPGEFRGLEGEGRLRLSPRALRKAYLRAVEDHLEAVEDAAQRFQYDYALLDTGRPVGPALRRVLTRRAAFLRKGR